MTTLQSIVTPEPGVLFRDLGGESVVLNPKTDKYHTLDELATRMWVLLFEHGRVEDVYYRLLDEYEVEADRLREDLLGFVDELIAEQLVRLDGA